MGCYQIIPRIRPRQASSDPGKPGTDPGLWPPPAGGLRPPGAGGCPSLLPQLPGTSGRLAASLCRGFPPPAPGCGGPFGCRRPGALRPFPAAPLRRRSLSAAGARPPSPGPSPRRSPGPPVPPGGFASGCCAALRSPFGGRRSRRPRPSGPSRCGLPGRFAALRPASGAVLAPLCSGRPCARPAAAPLGPPLAGLRPAPLRRGRFAGLRGCALRACFAGAPARGRRWGRKSCGGPASAGFPIGRRVCGSGPVFAPRRAPGARG